MFRQVIAVEPGLVRILQHAQAHVVVIGDAKAVAVNPVENTEVNR